MMKELYASKKKDIIMLTESSSAPAHNLSSVISLCISTFCSCAVPCAMSAETERNVMD